MNKLEFLTRMRNKLESGGLPAEDINDALTYYEEVFLDAGFGKEEETAASIGLPEDIAADILRESGIDPTVKPQPVPQQKKRSTGAIVAITIIAILTSPIWATVLVTVVSVLFALAVALISVIFALICTAAGLIFAGIPVMFELPGVGLMSLGGGLILTGIALLVFKPAFVAAVRGCGKFITSFCKWFAGLFKKGGKVNE